MPGKKDKKILKPRISKGVFIAEGVHIYGDVEICRDSSIWFNAVIRGDEGRITVGEGTNIQDNCVIHSDMGTQVVIGSSATIGHGAVIRGCRIGDNVMVGMNSTIMTGSEIGEASIIGANSFVPYNKKFPPRSLIIGAPARFVRELTDEEIGTNAVALAIYRKLTKDYSKGRIKGYKKAPIG